MSKRPSSSWEEVNHWYDKLVGSKGHGYHRSVIFPKLLHMLPKQPNYELLDLGCGQGVLGRILPKFVSYTGVDLSPSLIEKAQENAPSNRKYLVADATEKLDLPKNHFDCITVILALQDMPSLEGVFSNISYHLKDNGSAFFVLNHPCFRIPKHSHWEIDDEADVQYRRMDSYLSKKSLPILTEPSKGKNSPTVFSYHRPLSFYVSQLAKVGLAVSQLEEWISPKKSTGRCAQRENKARREFPLFLFMEAKKL